jgi:DNA processing protein
MRDEDAKVIEDRRRAWLTLSLVAGLGPITLRRAVASAFSVLGALKLSHAGWGEVDGIGSYRASQIIRDLDRAKREAEQISERCERLGIAIVTLEDENYPGLARDLPDMPTVLYARGRLEPRDLNAVAMVGSRKCSFYGRDQASRLSSLLAGAGVTVVSGGARGVDSASHEGAMRVDGGRTIAVLGCGVDVVYPPENAPLFEQIIAKGALISHYPPGTAPNQRHFPERNRVISGISRGVVVVEADERSGSLITARLAADDHNRPVLAVPGRIDNPLSSGPHNLIKQGAALVTNLDDVLEALGPPPETTYKPRRHAETPIELFEEPASVATPASLSGEQESIIDALKEHREAAADVLIETTGLPAAVVLRELTLLTLKGRVRRVDAQTYAAK